MPDAAFAAVSAFVTMPDAPSASIRHSKNAKGHFLLLLFCCCGNSMSFGGL